MEPEEQKGGEPRDCGFLDLWSGSKGRRRAVEIDLKHLNEFLFNSAPILPKTEQIVLRSDTHP